jgi:predicted metal-dependent phosphoesterase TrpH
MRVDLHIHTQASPDALSSLPAIIKVARKRCLQAVAITDHNKFCNWRSEAPISELSIINGEEVETREGEIIGLFLQHHIPKGLSPEETIRAIQEQGAVTYLPHPFKQSGNHPWSKKGLEKILPLVDIVEVFNGRLLDQGANQKAYDMAAAAGVLMGAGSDAHTPWEVGRAFVDLAEFDSPAIFLHNLRNGKIFGRPPSRIARILMNRFSRKLVRHLLLNRENLPLLKKLWLPF